MKAVQVVAAAIIHDEKILIVRRGPKQSGAGEWEFPGGKIEVGESSESALNREIYEELHLQVKVQKAVGKFVYHYPAKDIELKLFFCILQDGAVPEDIYLLEHDAAVWVRIEELEAAILSPPDRPFVDLLKKLI